MATRKFVWVLLSGLIAAWLLSPIPQTVAETWNVKFFQHTTKVEALPIPDAEGHMVGVLIREGVSVYDNKELGWTKVVNTFDVTKGVGSFSEYAVTTFQDGSIIISYTTGKSGGQTAEFSGEIIHGTGRFQGIRGTATSNSVKNFPPEKGEIIGKAAGELTLNFTLPPK